MPRRIALRMINQLYGLEESYVQLALEALGPDTALSDAALEWIAERQQEEQNQSRERLLQIEAYQQQNPHLSWQECRNQCETEDPGKREELEPE